MKKTASEHDPRVILDESACQLLGDLFLSYWKPKTTQHVTSHLVKQDPPTAGEKTFPISLCVIVPACVCVCVFVAVWEVYMCVY